MLPGHFLKTDSLHIPDTDGSMATSVYICHCAKLRT